MVRAPLSPSEAHHGYEQRDVPKEDELVGAPQRHVQVLHFVSMQYCQATNAHGHFESPSTK